MKENIWLCLESLLKSEPKNVNCRLLFDYLTNGVRVVGHPPSSRAFSATETETTVNKYDNNQIDTQPSIKMIHNQTNSLSS
jgi:hypothetical protein